MCGFLEVDAFFLSCKVNMDNCVLTSLWAWLVVGKLTAVVRVFPGKNEQQKQKYNSCSYKHTARREREHSLEPGCEQYSLWMMGFLKLGVSCQMSVVSEAKQKPQIPVSFLPLQIHFATHGTTQNCGNTPGYGAKREHTCVSFQNFLSNIKRIAIIYFSTTERHFWNRPPVCLLFLP